jgi:ABC-type nitrate/sulfonate/bicarbonate transport system permease component
MSAGESINTPRRSGAKISHRSLEQIISVLSPFALLLLWEILAHVGVIDTRFFPPPSSIVHSLVATTKSGELLANTWISLQRLFWGFVVGAIPALVLGVAMGLNRYVRAVLEPLVTATYPIPKSSILPLALLIFGLGEASKIFMVALGVFFPVIINTLAGVLEINPIYLDVGKNFKASRWNTFRTIAIPGALPMIMTGLRLGIGMGLVLIAIAEMVGAKSGLGYMIWNAWETFSVEQMYVGLFVIAIIGFLLTAILNAIERLVVPWRAR